MAEIKEILELAEWLRKQRRDVSVVFAARAALRVLPIIHSEERTPDYWSLLVLPVFRATAIAWAAVAQPAYPMDIGLAAAAARVRVPSAAAEAASAALAAAGTVDPAAASAHAATATASAVRVLAATLFLGSGGTLAGPAGGGFGFWSAVSADATGIENGAMASVIASSPLWPNSLSHSPYSFPERLWFLWEEMKAALLVANDDWDVWTTWYEDRLEGRVREDERELAYVRIGDALWKQGPAIVNAEIKRRIEALERLKSVVAPTGPITADIEPPASETNFPFIGRLQPATLQSSAYNTWDTPLPLRTEHQPSVPPLEAIPEQAPASTNFRINPERLIDVVPDPPTAETLSDSLQRELYSEVRRKARALVELGGNLLADLVDPATRFRDCLPEPIEDLSIVPSWSRGNSLRSRLKAHDLSTSNGEPDPARLPPLVAEALRDLVHTWNIFIVGDPKGRELDEIRLGPQEVEEAKQVIILAAPVVEAIESSENVATALAKDAVVEQAKAAKNAPAGIDGDQAIALSRKTTANFVVELLRRAYSAVRGEAAFVWEKGRAAAYGAGVVAAYNNSSAIISFIAQKADALKEFVTAAWHNPTLIEIIDRIIGRLP